MEIKINSKALNAVLDRVGLVVTSFKTLPNLENILVEPSLGGICVSATDLETYIRVEIQCDTDLSRGICIPYTTLKNAIRLIKDKELIIDIQDNYNISVKYDNGSFSLMGFSAGDYPIVPEIAVPGTVNVSAISLTEEELRNSLSKTIPFLGKDEIRPVLNGVYVEGGAAGLNFVSTDAFKLMCLQHEGNISDDNNISAIIPGKSAQCLSKVLSLSDNIVSVQFSDKHGLVVIDDITVVFRLVDGKYPSYKSILPTSHRINCSVKKDGLIGALKRASVFTNETTNKICIDISNDRLEVIAKDTDFNKEFKETVECKASDSIKIGFNHNILISCISMCEDDNITLLLNEPNKAMLIKENNQIVLCMPQSL